jgi:DNA-binding NarL/FixJ family response regulator
MGQTRVLVADDCDAMRRVICTLLESSASITLCGEANCYADLFKVRRESNPHVVLMDLRMPDEKRFNPAYVNGQLQGSCVLAMSIWNDEETIDLGRSYGAVKLLEKGGLTSTLIPAIEECMHLRTHSQHA